MMELIARIAATFRMLENLQQGLEPTSALTAVQRIYVLSHRVERVKDNIENLWLNDTCAELEHLEQIAHDAKDLAISLEPQISTEVVVQDPAISALRVLSSLYEKLGSSPGAEVVIAVAVAGIVSVGRWPAVMAYGLTMSAWMGKDTFQKAIEKALSPE